ncbi:MAG: RecX family transcriptional regulator [Bacteroidales bacterium]|nr:RecX family transcriptional regulator [Bacteroidales bacterium]
MADIKAVLSKLQKTCSKKECCSTDMYKKALSAMEGDEKAAAEIVASLIADKYIDDLRYCSAYAREKAQISGWGPIKISFNLRAKGMDKSIISQALEEVNESEAARKLDKILEVKYRSVEGEPDEKFRLIKFALTRGYEYNEVASAVNALLKRMKEEKLRAEDEENE